MNESEYVQEVIVYSHVLSTNELAQVEAYLQKNQPCPMSDKACLSLCVAISLFLFGLLWIAFAVRAFMDFWWEIKK